MINNRFLKTACINYAKMKGWEWSFRFENFRFRNGKGEEGTIVDIDCGDNYYIAFCFLVNGKLEITDQFITKEFINKYKS